MAGSKIKTVMISVFSGAVGAALVLGLLYGASFFGFVPKMLQQEMAQLSGNSEVLTQHKEASTQPAASSSPQPQESLTLAEEVSAHALPSVASLDVEGRQGPKVVKGVGSGVVLDTQGHIVTNNHVVAGATIIRVTVQGKQYEGVLVGTDPSSDLAVIKIDAEGLVPMKLSDSDTLKVGQWVMAIGSPFGLEQSVSTGIVSSLYRSTTMRSYDGYSIYANLIQTDAAINPGNSGGALVNNKGELVGINTLIESTSGSSSGVGFAIPVNYAKRIADQIIAGTGVSHAFLGVSLNTVTAQNARIANLHTDFGAYVVSTVEQGPAEKAEILAGDVIVAVNGEQVLSADDLILKVRARSEGDKITLSVVRGDKRIEIDVVLGRDTEHQQGSDAKKADQNTKEQDPFDLYEYYRKLK